MLFRAVLLLALVVALSAAATIAFGERILVALGFVLLQLKVILGKLWQVRPPEILAWLKLHGTAFFRKDLLMKWVSSYAVPLLLGKAVFRRMSRWVDGYRRQIADRYTAMMDWYDRLGAVEKTVAALIVLVATLGLSVSSLGLWLILFSVKLPFWVASGLVALLRTAWLGLQKTAFRTIAFLQLGWFWAWLRPRLPRGWLARKRRLDYRIARAVIRRRRMTVQQLAGRKDRLPFRTGVLVEWLFLPRKDRPVPPPREPGKKGRSG